MDYHRCRRLDLEAWAGRCSGGSRAPGANLAGHRLVCVRLRACSATLLLVRLLVSCGSSRRRSAGCDFDWAL